MGDVTRVNTKALGQMKRKPCSVEYCPYNTDVHTGRYGGLCSEHRQELAELIRIENKAGAEPLAAGKAAKIRTVESRTRELLSIAQKVDRAIRNRRLAEHELLGAIDDFSAQLVLVRDSVRVKLEAIR